MYTELYKTISDSIVNKGYIVIDNALENTLLSQLLSLAEEKQDYKLAGISQADDFHLNTQRRSDKIKWLDDDTQAQNEYLQFTQGLQQYLNRTVYLGLNYYEAHFALYEKGDFYEKHLDSFKNSRNRIITTVLYLHKEWLPEDGGELLLYDQNNFCIEKIIPYTNRFVIFLSEQFPHEVLPANKTRHSIAGWFRIDKKLY